jgi:hypothetical protein
VRVRNATEERTAVSLHDSQCARTVSLGEKNHLFRVTDEFHQHPKVIRTRPPLMAAQHPLHLQGADLSSEEGCPVIRATSILTTSLDTIGLRSHTQNAFLSLRLSIIN